MTPDPADTTGTRPLRVRPARDRPEPGDRAVPPRDIPSDPPWTVVSVPTLGDLATEPIGARQVLVRLVTGIVLVLAAVTIGSSVAARRLAEREAVNDSAGIANVLAESVVQPALSDELLAGDAAALGRFDRLVRDGILGENVVRVKIWSADGTVVYADQSELVGRVFPLDRQQLAVLDEPRTVAEISELDRAENALDRDAGSRLVEVYRPVWTASGEVALFEIYTPYRLVSERSGQLWRGFAGVTVTSLLLFVVLLSPLVWHLAARSRRDHDRRERLLERAVDASDAERRRIAANLHDGPVQDLAATSFVVAGATAHAETAGHDALVRELQRAARSVRTSIRSLRTLLVDIYPPSLERAGLVAALTDLARSQPEPDLDVRVGPLPEVPLGLTPDQERLVFRVARETVHNAARHAAPCTVHVDLTRLHDEVVLEVYDDGPGFDATAVLEAPRRGHLGLQLLAELSGSGGALLRVASAPGAGTRWQLRVRPGATGGQGVEP